MAEVQRQVKIEHLCDRLRDRIVYLANALDILRQHQRLMGDVQPGHGQRHAGFQHHFGGFGIDEDVELCDRRGIAGVHAAAHKYDALDAAFQLGMLGQQQGDVGHRAGHHQGHWLRAGAQQVGDQLDGAAGIGFDGRRRQVGVAHAGFAVNIVGDYQFAH